MKQKEVDRISEFRGRQTTFSKLNPLEKKWPVWLLKHFNQDLVGKIFCTWWYWFMMYKMCVIIATNIGKAEWRSWRMSSTLIVAGQRRTSVVIDTEKRGHFCALLTFSNRQFILRCTCRDLAFESINWFRNFHGRFVIQNCLKIDLLFVIKDGYEFSQANSSSMGWKCVLLRQNWANRKKFWTKKLWKGSDGSKLWWIEFWIAFSIHFASLFPLVYLINPFHGIIQQFRLLCLFFNESIRKLNISSGLVAYFECSTSRTQSIDLINWTWFLNQRLNWVNQWTFKM